MPELAANPITFDDYNRLARLTESRGTNDGFWTEAEMELRTRLIAYWPQVYAELNNVRQAIALSDLDVFKKAIYYGKSSIVETNSDKSYKAKTEWEAIDKRRDIRNSEFGIRFLHGILGLVTELEELIDSFLLFVEDTNQPYNEANWNEEVGDLLWYCSLVVDSFAGSFQNCAETNIRKLQTRYPEKFNSEKALVRDLDKEKEVLGTGLPNQVTAFPVPQEVSYKHPHLPLYRPRPGDYAYYLPGSGSFVTSTWCDY